MIKTNNNILFFVLFILFLSLILTPLAAASESCAIGQSSSCDNGSAVNNSPLTPGQNPFLNSTKDLVCIVYFYGNTCSHCANIKPFINEIEQKYLNQIILTRYEVSDPENIKLYDKLCSLRNYNGQSIPLIGINDKVLVGEKQIRDNLENEINRGINSDKKICPLEGDQCHLTNETNNQTDTIIPKPIPGPWPQSLLAIIFVAGLSDGVNPCAFVILIFIMVFLQQISGNKKRLLKITITYILAILLTNFVLGVIYFYLSINIGYPGLIKTLVIIISLAAAAINIKDFFFYGKGISLGIPKSAKNYLMALIHRASVPAALILGISVAILEAPCSIPIYLTAIEVLKAGGKTIIQVLPYIIIYNLMFVLPLVVLSVAVYFGYDAKLFEEKSLAAKRYMKLVIGIVLILLALALIFKWI